MLPHALYKETNTMSFGKNSTLYTPLTAAMLPELRAAFPKATALDIVDQFSQIMTDHCVCELLLAVTNLRMIENHLEGRSAYLPLSAIKRNKRGKMQTSDMVLIHDVFVEQFMAGRSRDRLFDLLSFHGLALVTMHSCGGDVIPFDLSDSWYDEHADEQLLRTTLDWSGTSSKGVTEQMLFSTCVISQEEYQIVRDIVRIAFAILESQQELLLVA
jgi:hypothetical protein